MQEVVVAAMYVMSVQLLVHQNYELSINVSLCHVFDKRQCHKSHICAVSSCHELLLYVTANLSFYGTRLDNGHMDNLEVLRGLF